MQTVHIPEGLAIGAIVDVTVGGAKYYTNVIFDGWCPVMKVLRFKTGDDKELIFVSTVGQCISLSAGSIHTEAPGESTVPEIDLDALNEAVEEGEGGSEAGNLGVDVVTCIYPGCSARPSQGHLHCDNHYVTSGEKPHNTCNHTYSRAIDQPLPRICEHCGDIEPCWKTGCSEIPSHGNSHCGKHASHCPHIQITEKPPIDIPGFEVGTFHDVIAYDSDSDIFTVRDPESANGTCHIGGHYCLRW